MKESQRISSRSESPYPYRAAILALDPGGTTGWCYHEDLAPISDGYTHEVGQIDNKNHHQELFNFLVKTAENRIAPRLHIVCERFEHRPSDSERPKIEYISGEYVGVVRLFCQMHKTSGVSLFLQSAAQVKGKDRDGKSTAYFDDAKIKKLALWFPGPRHAMDATRHYLWHRAFTLGDTSIHYKLK